MLLGSGFAAAQAYKWVDENGVVHYSDRPQPGAEEVVLPRSPTPALPLPEERPATAAQAAPAGESAPAAEPAPSYQSLSVVSPAPEVTLWNIGGVLDVDLALQPGLQPGHQMRIYFDGAVVSVPGTSFQIDEVYRGEHNIQAEVVNEYGELQIRSENTRFYVQQTTIIGR